jgi:hypothetical protein
MTYLKMAIILSEVHYAFYNFMILAMIVMYYVANFIEGTLLNP